MLERAHQPEDVLVAEHVSKRFGATRALEDVTVSFRAGEVHALMGENGAGKSTLGKVIAGLHQQDAGTVRVGGRVLMPGDMDEAFDAGVRIVHQELAQCPNLSVAENLMLHDLPTTPWGTVDRRAMRRRAMSMLAGLAPEIDPDTPLGSLSPGHRQIVQIAAALDEGVERARGGARGAHAPRVIVFDEPTSSLSIAEADRLLAIIRHLAARGITIIYVSHRMGEIFAVCDRVTVLRDGRCIATSVVKDIDEPALVEQMIGRRLDGVHARDGEGGALRALADGAPAEPSDRTALNVRAITSPAKLNDVCLTVRAGEIVGLAGLVGCGRSELLDAIFGLDRAVQRGEVRVEGRVLPRHDPRAAIAAGVGYVPEDRRLQGLFFQLGVGENMLVPFMHRLAHTLGLRSAGSERDAIAEKFREFRVKAASPAHPPGTLSGGNQQKLLLARWMGSNTRVLLLDEPTRGIDVATKAEVYRLVRDAARAGAAVLLVSSEMPELLALADRVLVMCGGRITGELRGPDMTQENILRLATLDSSSRPNSLQRTA